MRDDAGTDDELDDLRRVHAEAVARLPREPDPVPLVGAASVLAQVAGDFGFAHESLGLRPKAWRCAGTLEAPCEVLVATRGGYCDACAAETARALRRLHLQGARRALPADAPTFRDVKALTQIDRGFIDAAETWSRDVGSLTFLGTSGLGKTTCALALLRRIVDRAETKALGRDDLVFAKHVRFVEVAELAQARRREKLGTGAPSALERIVRTASLVVLDDLGKEDQRDKQVVVEAIVARRTGPMVVTSELTREAIAARYGVAIRRRVIERATVVEAFR
jgi:DNA replication protein DnaC